MCDIVIYCRRLDLQVERALENEAFLKCMLLFDDH